MGVIGRGSYGARAHADILDFAAQSLNPSFHEIAVVGREEARGGLG